MCEVDYADVVRDVVFAKELLALAVSETEEEHIDGVEGHLCGEAQVGFAEKTLVDISHRVPGVRLAVCKHNLCLGVI